MEAFTLVIWWLVGVTTQEHRTPGLPEIECQRMAAGVKAPKKAKCVREDIPSPDELPLPARSPGAPPVICPAWGPCWQYGRPIRGA